MRLEAYGYEVTSQAFSYRETRQAEASLSVLSPSPLAPNATAFTGSAVGEIQAPLLAGGLGQTDELVGLDVAGKVALLQRGQVTFAEKVRNAERAGAVAVIISNNRPGNFQGDLSGQAAIPAVSVSQADGDALRALLDDGPVSVSLQVASLPSQGTSQNVVGKLRKRARKDRRARSAL